MAIHGVAGNLEGLLKGNKVKGIIISDSNASTHTQLLAILYRAGGLSRQVEKKNYPEF